MADKKEEIYQQAFGKDDAYKYFRALWIHVKDQKMIESGDSHLSYQMVSIPKEFKKKGQKTAGRLETMQQYVNGHVESIPSSYFPKDLAGEVSGYCDEDGWHNKKPFSCLGMVGDLLIFGPITVNGDETSISDETARKLVDFIESQ